MRGATAGSGREGIYNQNRISVTVDAGGEIASPLRGGWDLNVLRGAGEGLQEVLLVEEEEQLVVRTIVVTMGNRNRAADVVANVIVAVHGAWQTRGVAKEIVRVEIVMAMEEPRVRMVLFCASPGRVLNDCASGLSVFGLEVRSKHLDFRDRIWVHSDLGPILRSFNYVRHAVDRHLLVGHTRSVHVPGGSRIVFHGPVHD